MMARDGGPRRPRWLLGAGGLVMMTLAALLLVAALQPVTADRFGYALARPDGLPGHFAYQNMTYHAPAYCAGGADCEPARAARMTESDLRARGLWPLKQVASLPTLFGASHPILEPVNDPSMIGAGTPYVSHLEPLALYIAVSGTPGAYVIYMRDGGP